MIKRFALAGFLSVFTTISFAQSNVTKKSTLMMQDVVVKAGDTLWGISHTYLKDPSKWDEILKYNHLPTSDPTVALPGMTLHVPVTLIKTSLRAAHLIYSVNKVLFRRKDTAAWKNSNLQMELFEGDGLRTLEESKARVKFLNKELLSLDQNSLAVIRPTLDEYELELKSGSIFTGRVKVVTSNAQITPRSAETRYAARVEPDLSTKVEVLKGIADVDAQGKSVEVIAGMQTRVAPGLAPEAPRQIENLPELQAQYDEFTSAASVGGGVATHQRADLTAPVAKADATMLRSDLDSMHIGTPILGYRVQASREREFTKIIFDRKYDADEKFSPAHANLTPGAYWWRTSIIDLLGTQGSFSNPRYYTVGVKHNEEPGSNLNDKVIVLSPAEGELITGGVAIVRGVLRDDRLSVEINGRAARIDGDGNFSEKVTLNAVSNEIIISVSDGKGNALRLSRRVRRPQ